jgi:hypothetical protein
MRRFNPACHVLCALLLTAWPAAAQTTTATLTGRVVDKDGLSLPGVTIKVESPALQGILSVVSSENGDYIVPLLPPGTYKVTFELSGFEQQEKSVTLAPTQTLPMNITMGIAGLSESVEVRAATAEVLTQTAQVATNFKQDFIATLPTNRDINSVVLRAPGVHPSGPSGAYSIAGAASFESLFMVNGVSVNENLRGQALNTYIEDAVQETTVATDGVSAEFGRFSGGVVNVVTKSGANLFSGSFRDTLYNDNWRSVITGNDNFAPLAAGQTTRACQSVTGIGGTQIADPHCFASDSKVNKTVPQYEYVFGGPVLRDHLWFFTAGRFIKQEFARNTVAPLNLPYTATNDRKRFEVKLTGALNSNHRFEGAYTKEALTQVNDTFNTSTSMDLASLYTRENPAQLFTVNYSGVLTSHLFVEARYSRRTFSFINTGSQFTDPIQGTLLLDVNRGSLRYNSPTFCGVCGPEDRNNNDVFAKGTWFRSTKNLGSHSVVAGYDRFNDIRVANNHQSGSDYRILGTTTIVRGTDIFPQWQPGSTLLQYNPLFSNSLGTAFVTHSVFVNDSWRFNTHFTFNLGLRWDKNHGEDSAGALVAKDSAFSPRLGLVWDPGGDGKWSLNASFARYTAALSNSIADTSSAAGNPGTFQWAYQGPSINPDATAATLTSSADAIRQVFAWCQADTRGLCTSAPATTSSVPGVSVRIPDG